ncbi:NADH:ubiquinone reductase (Na(+)-transporting) subunit C [bacterium]|nr:NADH:ubiquinone reductase (Na(+)-transporting) subunit C [candidate division CSSED10-310 bacterium]
MHSNRYTMIFALVVCVSCSVLLAIAAESLKPSIQQNMRFDVQRNILKAMGLLKNVPDAGRPEIETIYRERIEEKVVDAQGNIVTGKKPADLDPRTDTELYPVYVNTVNDRVTAYCFPVSGKGLWSTIYGYIALENDGETVKGITFYKHGETPGLGGEIEKEWFTENFEGKKLFDPEGKFTPLMVAKGRVNEFLPQEKKNHMVDGISGATLTGRGINIFLEKDIEKYLPFLNRIRNSNG